MRESVGFCAVPTTLAATLECNLDEKRLLSLEQMSMYEGLPIRDILGHMTNISCERTAGKIVIAVYVAAPEVN